MLTLVTGASASGKSAYAEELAVKAGGRLCYIATMRGYGAGDTEFEQRVERHRALRAGKGFDTLESPMSLAGLAAEGYDTALLECISNLTANELFDGAGEGTEEAIFAGVERLCAACKNVIIVTNEVFSDGVLYGDETENYLRVLGGLNRRIAGLAQSVIEVVYGIPIIHKGGGSVL